MEEVKDPKKFIKECRRIVAQLLSRRHLHIQDKERPRGRRYLLCGVDATRAEVGDRTYEVIPFCRVGAKTYWLATSLDLVIDRGHRLANVSLVVFEGEATDALKTPIMRAEWDSEYPDEANLHAQPHWHVYSSQLAEPRPEERARFKPLTDAKPFVPDDLKQHDTNSGFHFAMASQWHLAGRGSHRLELEAEELFKWLDGCLSYIRSQLLSLS